MRLLIALGMLLASPALAQDATKKKGELGSEWFQGGNTYQAQVSFQIDPPRTPDPQLYRRIMYDWKKVPLQSGRYPAAAFAAGKEGVVGVAIDVGVDGKPSGCRVTAASGVAALDAHACPHVLAYTRYFPGLDRTGERVGGTVAATLRYTLRIYVESPAPGDGSAPPPKARLTAPVTLASLGVERGMLPANLYGIGAWVLVASDGHATACELYEPTQSDALDKQICDRLMAGTYQPGRDAGGKPVESIATVSLPAS